MTAPAERFSLPVQAQWFRWLEVGNEVSRIREPAVHPFLQANCWLVRGRDEDLLVDTGLGVGDLQPEVVGRTGREPLVHLTHGHLDHIGGAHAFATRSSHRAEVAALTRPEQDPLVTAELSPEFRDALAADSDDGTVPDLLLSARPDLTFDVTAYEVRAAPPQRVVEDGDVIDLGDRTLRVLHLPGHTPGSTALLEESTGLLFSGDVVYDAVLLDELPESNIADYCASMRRLVELVDAGAVRTVHAGHEGSFDADRLKTLCEQYLEHRA